MLGRIIAGASLALATQFAFAASDAPSGYTKCVQTGSTCSMTGTHQAAMGKSGVFGYATFTGSFACALTNFPSAPSNSTWCSYDPATASSSSSSASSSKASSSAASSAAASSAAASSKSSAASSAVSSAASSSAVSSAAASSAAASSTASGAPAIYNLNAPSMPSTVCATVSANLTKNSKNLLDDSVDAPPAATQPDTSRLQSAIDNCAAGAAVKLVTNGSKNAFLAGPLQLKSGVTLWIDSGVTLFASRNPDDYASTSGSCGIEGSGNAGCKPLIYAINTDGSGIVGAGAIDGRGGAVMTGGANAGKWTWWDLSMASTIDGKNQQSPRILQITSSKNFTLYNITLLNGPHFHVVPSEVVGFKAYGVKLITPSIAYSVAGYACASGTSPSKSTVATKPSTCFSPDTVKNTDGIDPANSQYVVVTQSYISTGDDNVAIKAGQVTSTSSVSTNQMYVNNHFYYGHGMSIGSETDAGAHDITVTNLTFDGQGTALAGLRIKSDNSRGGEVYNVTYDTVCMRNIKNPLFFTTQYTTASGSKLPNFHDITMRNVHYSSSTGTLQYVGSSTHPLNRFTFDNVVFDSALSTTQSNVTNPIYGPGAVVNVGLSGAPTISGSGINCSSAWIPMATAFAGYYQ